MTKQKLLVGLCLLFIGMLVVPGLVMAGDKININTADKETLIQLSGVGPVIADRIIEYREKMGAFKSVEEITEVKGIGPGTLMKIKEYIVVE
ncbi:MAG: ComEA family DNA-binding protein [Desulfobacteraceae bacterium]